MYFGVSDCYLNLTVHSSSYTKLCVFDISCYGNIVVNCHPNCKWKQQWHSPKTAVESPTLATKMLSCRNITVETVVPAVLRSPILFLFHVPVKPSSGNSTLMYTAILVNIYAHVRSHTKKKSPLVSRHRPPLLEGKGGWAWERGSRSLEGADKVNT